MASWFTTKILSHILIHFCYPVLFSLDYAVWLSWYYGDNSELVDWRELTIVSPHPATLETDVPCCGRRESYFPFTDWVRHLQANTEIVSVKICTWTARTAFSLDKPVCIKLQRCRMSNKSHLVGISPGEFIHVLDKVRNWYISKMNRLLASEFRFH